VTGLRRIHLVGLLAFAPLLGGCPFLPPLDPPNPVPPEAAAAITQACDALAADVQPYGVNTTVLTVSCAGAVNGTGPELLRTFLASPQLGCVALAGPVTALVPQVATACQEFATAIQPYSALLGGALPIT
jgi:hypothetical protein